MATHYEQSLQRDLDRIRAKVAEMGGLGERALRDCLTALQERNRQLAYTVILRDQKIDEKEKEIDRLCLEFIVRQQPVASLLRFAYATIRLNLELERIGDYAESIARQVLKLVGMNVHVPIGRFVEIAELAIPMFHESVQAFIRQDADLAKRTMEVEDAVDVLRNQINAELVQLRQENKISLEALTPLMTIARRFERVSDQAKNICQEVVFMCTGEYGRHEGADVFRLLFLDEHNSCRSQMAEAIGNSLNQPEFVFTSAGLDPKPMDPMTASFLKEKGLDISRHTSKSLQHVPNLEHYQIIVGLAKEVQRAIPPPPRKTIYLDWSVKDPSRLQGTFAEVRPAYEATYQEIHAHIQDLVEAVLGDKIN
ncbi:MAG: phosphate signaling complex protein PhoU [Verrucomicrobia bacterium]|nr:phosphate signaling complex protein PhoU [Verrucomicrobiota bacterium]